MKLNPRWLTGAALTLSSLAVYVWPNAMTALIWQRDALAEGQWWRLITAHFVHLNVRHLLWNLLGAWVICELLWDQLELHEGLMLCGASALGVSLLLWFCQPAFFWYAGLSGVLHGLWAGAAGAAWCRRPSLFFSGALILLLGKLAWPVGSIAGMAVASLWGAHGPCLARLHRDSPFSFKIRRCQGALRQSALLCQAWLVNTATALTYLSF